LYIVLFENHSQVGGSHFLQITFCKHLVLLFLVPKLFNHFR
jgi:hypothetical protein